MGSFQKRAAAKTWLLTAIAIIAVGLVLKATVLKNDGPQVEIETAKVTTGPLIFKIETSGTIEPLSTVQVGCQVMGRIIETPVDNDQPVTKNMVIARIDPDLMTAEFEQADAEHKRLSAASEESKLILQEQRANLPVMTQQAEAKKRDAEAALVESSFTYDRVKGLYENKNAGEAEWNAVQAAKLRAEAALKFATAAWEQAKNNEKFLVQRAEQAVDMAAAAMNVAKARLDATQTKLDQCVIRSPIDGIVLKRFTEVGTTVNPAFQIQPLYLLAPSLKRMRVSAKVSESDIVHIQKGQPARFTIEGRGRSTFEGTILEKRNQPDIIQNVVTYTVIFEVDNDERGTLLPGLTVNVEIECVRRDNAVQIPNTALRFKPPIPLEERQAMYEAAVWPPEPMGSQGKSVDYTKKGYAWRYDQATREWTLIPFWIGITDNIDTEVIAGAKEGDTFVKKFVEEKSGGYSFQEMLKQASPEGRKVF